jgi:hypothetical protein
MWRALLKARWPWLLVPLTLASCEDGPPPPGESGGNLAPCLEQPTALARPPSGQLPCELLPPGFSPSAQGPRP